MTAKQVIIIAIFSCVAMAAYKIWDPVFLGLYPSGEGKKAIVIGATGGMGRETARLLMKDGYTVGCVGRRQQRLDELKVEYGDRCVPRVIDMSKKESAQKLHALIHDMQGCDLMMICISAHADKVRQPDGSTPHSMQWQQAILKIDLMGCWRAMIVARNYFEKQGHGHIVGVSSISRLIGESSNFAYCAAKAFMQRYLEATRNYMLQHHIPIAVTDIIPGFVDVEYEAPGSCSGEYWNISAETAGKQIFEAIKARKDVAYVGRRWRIIAWLYSLVPTWLYNAVGGF